MRNLILLVLRFVAGVPLLGLGLKHAIDSYQGNPQFEEIMKAAQLIPANFQQYTEAFIWIAIMLEMLGGILMIGGVMAHLGGLFGLATMGPAIFATLEIAKLPEPHVFVPPLPIPMIVAICSGLVALLGSGDWGIDGMRYSAKKKEA